MTRKELPCYICRYSREHKVHLLQQLSFLSGWKNDAGACYTWAPADLVQGVGAGPRPTLRTCCMSKHPRRLGAEPCFMECSLLSQTQDAAKAVLLVVEPDAKSGLHDLLLTNIRSVSIEGLVLGPRSQVPTVKGKPDAENQAFLLELSLEKPLPAARRPNDPLGCSLFTVMELTASAQSLGPAPSDTLTMQTCLSKRGSPANPQVLDQLAQVFLTLLLKMWLGEMMPRGLGYLILLGSLTLSRYVLKTSRWSNKNTVSCTSLFPTKAFL